MPKRLLGEEGNRLGLRTAWPLLGALITALVFALWVLLVPALPAPVRGLLTTARFLVLAICLILAAWLFILDERRYALRMDRCLQNFVQTTHAGIIVANRVGTVTYANPAACRMFGWEALEGLPLTSLMPLRFREDHTRSMVRFLAKGSLEGEGRTLSVMGLRVDGSEFPAALSLTVVRDGPLQVFGILRDMTDEYAAVLKAARELAG